MDASPVVARQRGPEWSSFQHRSGAHMFRVAEQLGLSPEWTGPEGSESQGFVYRVPTGRAKISWEAEKARQPNLYHHNREGALAAEKILKYLDRVDDPTRCEANRASLRANLQQVLEENHVGLLAVFGGGRHSRPMFAARILARAILAGGREWTIVHADGGFTTDGYDCGGNFWSKWHLKFEVPPQTDMASSAPSGIPSDSLFGHGDRRAHVEWENNDLLSIYCEQ